ncbi:DUF2513 domain-containing protein [Erysipelothrix anatis]|uniref:DUF2513 domain-containing protein n=1 Tax=Erysipelothrix anatis TaxID=2683713 RepID=UPI0013582CCC|nr:DUF2513 domain-containing protein [Erysipelothrix anatis]
MRLNQDCIRDLLLFIETIEIDYYADLVECKIGDYSSEELCYTGDKLLEAGYINGKISSGSGIRYYMFSVSSLTWEGHAFLDNIRDDGVWKDTKKVASKMSSISVGLIEKIAASVLSTIITKTMNG